MARTVRDVVAAARELLQDTRPPFRYSDQDLARQSSIAVGEMRRIRPDLFLSGLRADIPKYDISTLDATIPVPDQFFLPVVNFVAGRAEIRDDQFTVDGRAVTLIQLFAQAIGGRN